MFLKRTFSTVVLLGVLGAVIFAPSPWNNIVFFMLSVLLTFALVREICGIVRNLGMETFKNLTALFCVVITFLVNLFYFNYTLSSWDYFGRCMQNWLYATFYIVFVCIAIAGPLFILFSKNSGEKIKKLFNSMGIAFFIMLPVLLILIIYVVGEENKIYYQQYKFNYHFLFFVLLTKIGDIGAYVVGTVTNKLMKGGNHKMVPSISPGKSWEGAAGGLIVTLLLALGFHFWRPEVIFVKTVSISIITGILMFFGSMAGDLMESALKRAAKVKDSGSTIPGIGGVFDLVDSLFVTAPVAVLLGILLKLSC